MRVLEHDGGLQYNARRLGILMEKITKAAGLAPTGSWHILRHTYCSRLATNGTAPAVLKELARHVSYATTARYVHVEDEAMEKAIAGLVVPTSKTGEEVEAGRSLP